MGKKSKIGKQRKDKFYHLAKETGFRSRAAFKLLQLNRKFEFLQKARVLVDLCAAPGGWMQVAKQNMPVSSIVIGIDMYPIKPVPGCICLTHDITTPECQSALSKELQSFKADVFLNDGAPNVGQNWIYDAYSQTCLTLSALKLSCYNLREGGWFITKVFRSKDYNALMWVFKQLFKKVHATKPQASRSESAEIFIVCQHYLQPAKLDLRFFNPNYVFKDLEVKPQVKLDSESKSKKTKAEGYPDNTTILFKQLPVSTYMACKNPAIALQDAYEITIDDSDIKNHPSTTREILECCKDIKVLGRKDIRLLMNWWKVFQEKEKESKDDKEIDSGDENKENDIELSEDERELDEVDKQIKELQDEERRELKRKKKKTNKERTKLHTKMNLKMVHKNDLGPTEERETGVFQLSDIKTKKALEAVVDQEPDMVYSEDSDIEIKPKKAKYDPSNTYLDKSGMFYRSDESELEHESSDDIDSDTEGLGFKDKDLSFKTLPKKKVTFSDPNENHPLLTDLDYRDVKDKRMSKAELWFDKDIFKDVEKEEDEDYELDKMALVLKAKGGKMYRDNLDNNSDETDDNKENNIKKNTVQMVSNNDETTDSDSDSDMREEEDNYSGAIPLNEWDDKPVLTPAGKKRKKKEARILNDNGLALGTLMASSKKMKRDIIDAAWNRYAFNDEDLPDWFVQDEAKHMHKEMPVPKELVNEFSKRHEEINVRPIKKVGEAKARKKKRALRKMEKAKKKLEGVVENADVTEAEKARQVRQIYKKLKQPKAEIKYVVSKKHTAAKRAKRPPGVKGPYKVVDPRMKKDMRAKMRMDKKKSNKKGARARPLVKTRRGKK
ncbi:pre-rRNA 2'-O-ribose RNA methyltransferase FTSJ3 [Daktulosphaira vitifoliae]|uniref:pre-rRNA 2'-O-ribose RNA methyltransferase FTSJ3 n=1 Tax=Daktulosphaira vitifoliae TaxID=58002 RepID=UPI0021AA4D0D|nr:pre-rRNA 2'-O-ribose RNA methyltransferase FTSJ3 [Daktulosphaira vitifoliae]